MKGKQAAGMDICLLQFTVGVRAHANLRSGEFFCWEPKSNDRTRT
jgi:hypothetical protein